MIGEAAHILLHTELGSQSQITKIWVAELQFGARSFIGGMGISSMPEPSDNMMAFTLYHMVLVVFLFKDYFRSVLRFFGFNVPVLWRMGTWYGYYRSSPELSTKEQFRRQFKPMKFRSVLQVAGRSSADCRVCLVSFEQKCVVNKLECGHVFHLGCLEKWLDYCHVTCPLCRNYVLSS